MTIAELVRHMTGNARPALTFESPDERMELSFHVIANWISKISNLLVLDNGYGQGNCICIDLPLHWRSVVWHIGAWVSGMDIITNADEADVWVGNDPARAHELIDGGFPGPVYLQVMPSLGLRWMGDMPAGAEDASQAIMSCADALMAPDTSVTVEQCGEGLIIDEGDTTSLRDGRGDKVAGTCLLAWSQDKNVELHVTQSSVSDS